MDLTAKDRKGRGLLTQVGLGVGLPFLLLSAVSPAVLFAQEVVSVPDPQTCQGCRVHLEHVVTLGDRDGPGRVMIPNASAVDSRGNYYLGHGDGSSRVRQIFVFSPEGEFLRTIGREGEGPGEYQNIALMEMLPGDTLEIYDQRLRRRTVLGPDLTLLSTTPYAVGNFWRSVRLPDGRLAVNEHLRVPERLGYPFQLVNRSGEIERSFGMVSPEFKEGESAKYSRKVTRGLEAGSVWTLGSGDYLMELWDTTGARLQALQRETDWFEERLSGRAVTVDGPTPQAILRYVKLDSEEQLWVSGLVAREDWKDVASADPDFASSGLTFMELFEPIVEVIDSRSGELLVSEVFPDMTLGGFLGEDMMITYKEDEMGYPLLDIWLISVEKGRGR